MYSENGVQIDVDEVGKLIAEADVFGVGFAHFPERLIVDTRSNDTERPMVQVAEPTSGAQERLRWLRRRRPSLGQPEAFSFLAWPHSTRFLVDSGVWERIRNRIGADVDRGLSAQCERALRELDNLDRETMMALLRGENCATLWPPQDDDEDD